MSKMGPAAARAAKLTAKYGPHAVAAWKIGGEQVKAAARTAQTRVQNRRSAVDKARTVADGSVLKLRDDDEVVWVVYAGDRPVGVYPKVDKPIEELVQDADLDKRRTPEEMDELKARKRARRLARQATGRVTRRGSRRGPDAIG